MKRTETEVSATASTYPIYEDGTCVAVGAPATRGPDACSSWPCHDTGPQNPSRDDKVTGDVKGEPTTASTAGRPADGTGSRMPVRCPRGSSSLTPREKQTPSANSGPGSCNAARWEDNPEPVPSLSALHDWSAKNGWGESLLWRGYVTQRRRGIWRDPGGGGRRLRRENRPRSFSEPDPEPEPELFHQSVVLPGSGSAPSLEHSVDCEGGADSGGEGDGNGVYVKFSPQGLRLSAAGSQHRHRHQFIAFPTSGPDPVDSLSPPAPSCRSPISHAPGPIPVPANRRPSLVSAFSFSSCSTASSSSLSAYSVESESAETTLRPRPLSPSQGTDGEGGIYSDNDEESDRHCGVEGAPSHENGDSDDVGFSHDDELPKGHVGVDGDADTWRFSFTSEDHRVSIVTAYGVYLSTEKPGLVCVVGGREASVSPDDLCQAC